MELIADFINNPTVTGLTKLLLVVGIAVIIWNARVILNRIKLLEFKDIAQNHALNVHFKNGFQKDYDWKLEQLKKDNKFKIKGE